MPYIISLSTRRTKLQRGVLKLGYSSVHDSSSSTDYTTSWICSTIAERDLCPKGSLCMPSPDALAFRLWSAYQVLAVQALFSCYTSASTIIHDSHGSIISAFVGDTSAFVAAYNVQGQILGMFRLSQANHQISNPRENNRITACGGAGIITDTTRGIGNISKRDVGFCADAKIAAYSKAKIADILQIPVDQIACLKVILTNANLRKLSPKIDNELFELLEELGADLSESFLATHLAERLKSKYPGASIELLIQSLDKASVTGFYEGKNGIKASEFVAMNIRQVFAQQCAFADADYSMQTISVQNNLACYTFDNPSTASSDNPSTASSDNTSTASSDNTSNASSVRKRNVAGFFPAAEEVTARQPMSTEDYAAHIYPFIPGSEQIHTRTLTSIVLDEQHDELTLLLHESKRKRVSYRQSGPELDDTILTSELGFN